jgi:hypothetical protein
MKVKVACQGQEFNQARGMSARVRDRKIGAHKSRAKLGDEFFHRVAFIAPALAPEVAL